MQYGRTGISTYAQQVCWLPLESIALRGTCTGEQASDQSLTGLAESIRTNGLMKPITVQQTDRSRYTVISGNRRLLACRMLGMTHIDAVILWTSMDAGSARQLLDGLMTGRMHYLEQARALHILHTVYGMSREELGRTLGQTPGVIADRIRLNTLDLELQALLLEEHLPERVAYTLLRVPEHPTRLRIARQIVRQHLTPREVEALISSAVTRQTPQGTPGGRTIARIRDHRLYLNAIRSLVAQMKEAGVETAFTEQRKADRVELTIALSTRKRRCRM